MNEFVIDVFIALVVIGVCCASIEDELKYRHFYIYTGFDGNTGETDGKGACSYDSYHGQGAMICTLNDGTVIQVKQYKYVKELED